MNVSADAFVVEVERKLGLMLRDEGVLGEAARHLLLAPAAKRARPRLCHAMAELCGLQDKTLAEDIAVAVEAMHCASLLHDDVVDVAATRRGRASVNALHGNTLAVLAGDLTLARGLVHLSTHGGVLLGRALAVVEDMTRAAGLEVLARGNDALPLAEWRNIAMGKTGALFGACGELIALAVNNGALAQRLRLALRHIGIAFQIADDVADLWSDGLQDAGVDLRDGTPSFPVLVAAASDPAIRSALQAGDTVAALARIRASAAPRIALGAADNELQRGKDCLLASERDHQALRDVWLWAARLTALPAPLIDAAWEEHA